MKMATYEIEFWNGDVTEVDAETLKEAKELAESENPGIGVKKAVLIGDDDDDAEEDENPDVDEDEDEEEDE
jgi:hypothetical protein